MAGRVYDYGRFRATASRLVGRFGVTAEFRQNGVDHPTTVVVTDYKSNQYDGTRIVQGDFMALVAAADLPVVPLPGSALYWQGVERSVVGVSATQPGPVPVIYTLQLRGLR